MINEKISLDELSGTKELDVTELFSNEVLARINVDPMLGSGEDVHGENLPALLEQIRESKLVHIDPSQIKEDEGTFVSASLEFDDIFDERSYVKTPTFTVSTNKYKRVTVKEGGTTLHYAEPVA